MSEEDAHIVAEIHIHATAEQIWSVLMDYDTLPEWSNGFLGTDKPMKAGEVSTAYFKNPITGGKIAFEHEVIVYEPGRAFGWSGEIGMGHHDRHIYEIDPQGEGGCIFRPKDGILGKPSNFMTRIAASGIKLSYDSFNKRLKKRVEALHG